MDQPTNGVIPPGPKSHMTLIMEDLQRKTLEEAARRIDALAGNEKYQAAWKVASRLIRSLKP